MFFVQFIFSLMCLKDKIVIWLPCLRNALLKLVTLCGLFFDSFPFVGIVKDNYYESLLIEAWFLYGQASL